jgi:integrase
VAFAALTFGHLQLREGRWAIDETVGMGKRLRAVPMSASTKVLVGLWLRRPPRPHPLSLATHQSRPPSAISASNSIDSMRPATTLCLRVARGAEDAAPGVRALRTRVGGVAIGI